MGQTSAICQTEGTANTRAERDRELGVQRRPRVAPWLESGPRVGHDGSWHTDASRAETVRDLDAMLRS